MSQQTPMSSSKRVHFNREVSKFSLGSKTPTISSLPSPIPKTPRSINSQNLTSQQNHHQQQQPHSNDNNLITVGVRVRPLSSKEQALGYRDCTLLDPDSNNTEICVSDKSNKTHKFQCDFVITDQTSPNIPVFDEANTDPNLIGLNLFLSF